MQKSREKIENHIETRLQFLITILVFFLATFPGILLAGAIIVSFYIIDYIFFVISVNILSDKILKLLNILVIIGIGSYIIPIAVISLSTQKGKMSLFEGYTWFGSTFISMGLTIIIPIAILIILSITGVPWSKIYKIK